MRKLIFISICCLFSFISYSLTTDVNVLRIVCKGISIDSWGHKTYDPSEGEINVNFDNNKIYIYTGGVFFNACPIRFSWVGGDKSAKEPKYLDFKEAYTASGEKCTFYLDLKKREAVFQMRERFIIVFENLLIEQ